MNILNKVVEDITFEDVVEACKAGTLESAVLDFKREMPGDLSKHFATFSNTLGGLIIIGVEEDNAGKPIKYGGVVFDSKLIDRVHQFAANVTPFPKYRVRPTNDVKGKVFILIKILPGDQPPYRPNSDTTVWIRTGNISTPLRSPDSRELEQMYKKREESEKVRNECLDSSYRIFEASLERAENERKAELVKNESVVKTRLGSQAAPLRISIMPVYPADSFVDFRHIKERLMDYRVETSNYGDFPDLNYETIPRGISFFNWSRYDGGFEFGLIQDTGIIDLCYDVLRVDKNGEKNIYIGNLLSFLLRQLKVAKQFYNLFGFNGLLHVVITLNNANDTWIIAMAPANWMVLDDRKKTTKIGDYQWFISDLDTFKLNDKAVILRLMYSMVEKFYWDLGLPPPNEKLVQDHLKITGWSEFLS